jgi:Undecaprenyl-phosphate galactose phosphotransferase WbaP
LNNKLILLAFDIASLALAFVAGFWIADGIRVGLGLPMAEYGLSEVPLVRLWIFIGVTAGLMFWLVTVRGHYNRRVPYWDTLRDIFTAVCFAALVDAAAMYMVKLPFARLAWAFTWLAVFLLVPVARRLAARLLLHRGRWTRPTLVIGSGENALAAWQAVESEPLLGYRVQQFCTLPGSAVNSDLAKRAAERNVPVGVGEEVAARFVEKHGTAQLVIALEPEEMSAQAAVVQRLSQLDAELMVAPPLKGLPLYGTEPMFFFSHEILLLRVRNNLARWVPATMKRLFDLVAASLGLVVISPLLLWIILRIRADGGPAIFKHKRIGQGGQSFACYKFRSMVMNSQQVLQELLARDPQARAEWEKDFKLKDDPRVTSIGAFLRKTSLDELPQLFNVLKGEMSLVGPRPIIEAEVERYGDGARFYFEAKPGITGLWQVSGRSDIDYPRRVMLDTWYVQNWSLWHDIVILFKTIRVVAGREGAY